MKSIIAIVIMAGVSVLWRSTSMEARKAEMPQSAEGHKLVMCMTSVEETDEFRPGLVGEATGKLSRLEEAVKVQRGG